VTLPKMLSLATASRVGGCALSRALLSANATALRATGGSLDAVREYATGDLTDGKPKTILAVLYKVCHIVLIRETASVREQAQGC
jgi:hypothetical protein